MKKMTLLSAVVMLLFFHTIKEMNQVSYEKQRHQHLTELLIERYENEIRTQKNKKRLEAVKKSYEDYLKNLQEHEYASISL